MPEEVKNPPEKQPEVPETAKTDTGNKSALDIQKQLDDANKNVETLKKQNADKDSMIGKQSTEIGDLRKVKEEKPAEELSDVLSKVEDADIREEAKRFIKEDKMTEEDAVYHAGVFVRRDRAKVRDESLDLIEEAVETGAIDPKIYGELKDDIVKEFQTRRSAKTARRNLSIFKDCVKVVTMRKADQLKTEGKKTDGETRDSLIDNANIETNGTRREEANKSAENKATDEIMNAGRKENSAFF